MKKWLSIVLAVVLVFGTGVFARDVFEVIKAEIRTDFVVEIDGVEREFKNVNGERVHPVLHNGTTYLPVRAIGEIMGKAVYWYEEEKRIELKDKKISSTVTDADVIVDEQNADKNNEKLKNDKVEKVYDDSNFIGKDKAIEIALNKAGLKEADVKYLEAEFDKERSVFVYEVEFNYGLKEYKAEIKGDDGTILKWEGEFDD